jgi:hypothetical protein
VATTLNIGSTSLRISTRLPVLGQITIKIRITIKKEILTRRLPHPEGVKDGSRSVEALRDLRNSGGWEIAP